MTDATKFPPPAIVKRAMVLRDKVMTMAIALKDGRVDDPEAMANTVIAEIASVNRRVKGNRSSRVPVTWDDLRLLFCGCLRRAQEMIESPETYLPPLDIECDHNGGHEYFCTDCEQRTCAKCGKDYSLAARETNAHYFDPPYKYADAKEAICLACFLGVGP